MKGMVLVVSEMRRGYWLPSNAIPDEEDSTRSMAILGMYAQVWSPALWTGSGIRSFDLHQATDRLYVRSMYVCMYSVHMYRVCT